MPVLIMKQLIREADPDGCDVILGMVVTMISPFYRDRPHHHCVADHIAQDMNYLYYLGEVRIKLMQS